MTRRAALGWFVAWAVVGVGWAISFVSFIGVLTIVPTILATIGLGVSGRQRATVGLPGLLVGIGLVPLFVAYIHRGGPGTACTRTASSETCIEHLDPHPWLVAGLVLVTFGAFLFTISYRGRASIAHPARAPRMHEAHEKPRSALGWFAGWTAIGAAWPGAVFSGFGMFVVPVVLAATIGLDVAGRGRRGRRGLPGLLVGFGLFVLVIGLIGGTTGTVQCSASSAHPEPVCTDHGTPLPWLIAGLALVMAGLVALALVVARASTIARGRATVPR